MSTRSRIGRLTEEGAIESVYCHSDGYLGGVGQILADYYSTEEDVKKLIALGDLSELGAVVGDKIGFDKREWSPSTRGRGWVDVARQCVAYGRDRGDPGPGPKTSASFDDLKREHLLGSFGPDHLYLFYPGEGWRWFPYPFFEDQGRLLSEVLAEVQQAIDAEEARAGR
ncbi:MAG: hypothetical protein J5I35_11045 [Methanothrix harundinacea]|nr:hypothetical protein [Methanothrix harundinacea]